MSSTRSFLVSYPIISNQSMASNITSLTTDIRNKDQIAICITSQNTSASGQWQILGSIDNINFVPVTFNPPIAATTSGNNDLIMLDMKLLSFTYIQVKWLGSGVGVATVTISAKGN